MRSIKSFSFIKTTVLLIVAQSFFLASNFAQNLLDSIRTPRFGSFNIGIGFLGYEKLKPDKSVGFLKFTPHYSPKMDVGYEYIFNKYKLGIEINAGIHASGMRITYDKSMCNDVLPDSTKNAMDDFFSKGDFGKYYLKTFNDPIAYFRFSINKYYAVSNKHIVKFSFGINRSIFDINTSGIDLAVIGQPYYVGGTFKPLIVSDINFNQEPNIEYNSRWYTALHFKVGIGQMVCKRLLMLELEYNQGLETIYTGNIVENEKYLNKKYTSTFSWTNNYLALNLQYGLGKWRKTK
jgi:hypothetical protein